MRRLERLTPAISHVSRHARVLAIVGTGLVAEAGCGPVVDATQASEPESIAEQTEALGGSNLGGANLGGTNLGGTNLAGTNLGGANLGGTNLGGTNLGGTNLGGTNLGGNNLGGNNLGGTNLGGTNLGGSNLGGSNLGGTNLGGSNLGGSNLGGTNLGGNNLGGTNLGGTNLGGANSGFNIHSLTGSVNGMLYSGEDKWLPKTGQCVVMGIGSTAFPKLLGQQTANATISVSLGKLPWGFASTSGGATTLSAWEAIVWGDNTYCSFVLASPTNTNWLGVAGFIKSVFRWNAPTTQTMNISGIEASAPYDSTLMSYVYSYTGMMNAGAQWRAGNILDSTFLAGELAFVSATTNNQSVMVDFSSWIQDKNKNALILGNVQATNKPNYAESMYMAGDNGDGTVAVVIADSASTTLNSMPGGMIDNFLDLRLVYNMWKAGAGPKPVPTRCGGALSLNWSFGEPVPAGKCDAGLVWAPSNWCMTGNKAWSTVSGTTAPMNSYMQMTQANGVYKRGTCGATKTILSETYIHMWGPNYTLPGACTPTTCSAQGKNCGMISDGCGGTLSCGSCSSPNTCGQNNVENVCGS